jgi:cytochrome P450
MEFVKRIDGRVACPFDHHSPEYTERFAEVLDEMRSQAPLVWSVCHGGFWVATTYDLVRKLRKESERLKLNQVEGKMEGGLSIPPSPAARHRRRFIPGETDGDEHDKYRLALNPMFTKRKVAELQPVIDRHIAAAIDHVLEKREFDVIEDLAGPSFAGISAEYLGFDVQQPRSFFKKFSSLTSYSAVSAGDLGSVSKDFREAWSILVQTVNDRREAPGDDVISHLVQWKEPAFTNDEVHSMVFNLILGSVDNVTNFVSQVLLYMDQHREVRDLLSARPHLMGDAVDEFLRLITPSGNSGRTVMEDLTINGVTLRAGERILLSSYAGNHDPAHYPHPYAFDVERAGKQQHLSFGVGEHFCLGAWLAKAVAATTLTQVLAHIPNYRIDIDRAQLPASRAATNSWLTMPAHTGGRPCPSG